MKVFISWSGEESRKVACALREWLPSVIQILEPYVSAEDIDKGARWSADIATHLEASQYGIICVTKENLNSQWINFEAGALSKKVDKSKVSPFLFRMKRADVQGPLLQFQSALNDEEDVLKLLSSINNSLPEVHQLTETALRKAFNVWWPSLDDSLGSIAFEQESFEEYQMLEQNSVARPDVEYLEEILDLVREQQRILTNPETILPASYFEYLFASTKELKPNTLIRFRHHIKAVQAVVQDLDLHLLVHSDDGDIMQTASSLVTDISTKMEALASLVAGAEKPTY